MLVVKNISGYLNKSWTASSNLDKIIFSEKNIIFGYNGAGKSSLKKGILDEYIKNNTPDTVRVFDSKYVNDTLLLEDRSGIRGIVSNFSKKDVDIEKKVKENNDKIKNLEEKIAKIEESISRCNKDIESVVKEVVKRRKGSNARVNNKSGTVDKQVELWKEDYEQAQKQFPNEDYDKITGNVDMSEEHDRINEIVIPNMPMIPNNFVNEISKIMTTDYKIIDIPSPQIISWLEQGLHIHENADRCEFCKGSININDISDRVNSYLNNEKYKATLELKEHQKVLIDVVDVITNLSENQGKYEKMFSQIPNKINFEDNATIKSHLSKAIKSIDQKLNEMELTFEFNAIDISKGIEDLGKAITNIEEKKRQSLEDIRKKMNKVEIFIKGAIGFEIKNSQFIDGKLKENEDGRVRATALVAECKEIREASHKLMAQKSNLADFAEYLNGVLKDQGCTFKLQLEGNVYVIIHLDGTQIDLSEISDGERNLLALIYFYYEMQNDPNHTIKDTIKLIVIDDPISSFDDNNKFYITTLIRSALECNTAQIFVLTHSWDDFCNISYGYQTKTSASLLEIKKIQGSSNIHHFGKKMIKPYKLLYKEIYDFSSKNMNDISDEETLHMPNVMRRVIEEYIKFNVDVDLATANNEGEISKALFKEEYSKIADIEKQKLKKMLSVCNILSHRSMQPKNPSEVHEVAKFLVSTINKHDKYHHMKMIG